VVFFGGELGHRLFMLFLRQEACNPGQGIELMFTIRSEGYIDAVAPGLTKERR